MLKEAEIDHSPISLVEKRELKQQWRWIESYTQIGIALRKPRLHKSPSNGSHQGAHPKFRTRREGKEFGSEDVI